MERYIRSNAQIDGQMVWNRGTDLGMEKNISDLPWFWMSQ